MNRLHEKPVSASAKFEQQVQVMAELISTDQSKAYDYLEPLIAIFGNEGAWELLLKAEVRAKEIISGNRKIVMPVVKNIDTQVKVTVTTPKHVKLTVVEPEDNSFEVAPPTQVTAPIIEIESNTGTLRSKEKNMGVIGRLVKSTRNVAAVLLFAAGIGAMTKAQAPQNGSQDQTPVVYSKEKVAPLDYGDHSATLTQGNENHLNFVGQTSTAFKFDVSKMYKTSSTNGKEGIVLTGSEIKNIAETGNLFLVLKLSDTTAIEVPIDASGKIEIPKDSEIGRHLKVNQQGYPTVVRAHRLIVTAKKSEEKQFALASIRGNMKSLTAKDIQTGAKTKITPITDTKPIAPTQTPNGNIKADSVVTNLSEDTLIYPIAEDTIEASIETTRLVTEAEMKSIVDSLGLNNTNSLLIKNTLDINNPKIQELLQSLQKNPNNHEAKQEILDIVGIDVDDEELNASDFGDTEPNKIDTVKTDSIPHASGLDNPQDFEKNLSPVKSHCELDSLPEMPVKTMVRITQEAEDWRCANHYPYFKNGNLVTRDAVVGIDPSTSRLDLFMQETGAFVVRNTNIDKEIAFFELDTSGRIKTYIPEGRMEPEDIITLNYIKYKIPKLSHLRIFEISVVDQHPFSFQVYIRNNQGKIFNETGDLTVVGRDLMIETKMGNKYVLSVSNEGILNIKTPDFVTSEQK